MENRELSMKIESMSIEEKLSMLPVADKLNLLKLLILGKLAAALPADKQNR